MAAREHVVGWYHTGPKLHPNDIAIHELLGKYCNSPVGSPLAFLTTINVLICFSFSPQVLVIVDARPKALGLPTDAYYAIEEVHDVRLYCTTHCTIQWLNIVHTHTFRMAPPPQRPLNMLAVRWELRRQKRWEWNTY